MPDHSEEDIQRINAVARTLNGKQEPPPNVGEHDVYIERLRSYVNNVTLPTLQEVQALRQDCDELIGEIHQCQESLFQHVHAYGQMAQSLINLKSVISDAIHESRQQFNSLPRMLSGKPPH